uniref:Uncharacterized protein At2g13130 n=1 Tax=Arabidopsis thaliana TaxID=3702 RepID=Q9SL55_ARATH|nr:hypothetical protein [Arabidopsis thaliana]
MTKTTMTKIPNLPDDLESEILSRIPAKSLTKLKTTCKRWYVLFRDPKFAKKNLGKSAREVMLVMNQRLHSISVNRHGIHEGVDPSMEFSENLRVAEFEIFDFGSDCGRVIDDAITWGIFSAGVSFNGNTYWIGGEKETGFFLMDFDFTTERFGRFPLPYQSYDYEDIAVLSVVKEEKLSLMNQNIHINSSEMKIWVTNKFDEAKYLSWSQFLVVDFDKFTLPNLNSVITFLLDEENKVALCCDTDMEDEERTKIYIVGVDLCKQVFKEVTKGSVLNWPCFVSYAPNLVHIQKDTPKVKKKLRAKEVSLMDHLSFFLLFLVVMFL